MRSHVFVSSHRLCHSLSFNTVVSASYLSRLVLNDVPPSIHFLDLGCSVSPCSVFSATYLAWFQLPSVSLVPQIYFCVWFSSVLAVLIRVSPYPRLTHSCRTRISVHLLLDGRFMWPLFSHVSFIITLVIACAVCSRTAWRRVSWASHVEMPCWLLLQGTLA